MNKTFPFIIAAAFLMLGGWFGVGPVQAGEDATTLAELDNTWKELARTVREGDFTGYKACYHDDAVYVSGLEKTSHPLADAFARWQNGFIDTRAGRIQASVKFRFSQRLGDGTTAHETGIFYYSTVEAGQVHEDYVHFEALLINKKGWKILMEYQKSKASKDEWDALK